MARANANAVFYSSTALFVSTSTTTQQQTDVDSESPFSNMRAFSPRTLYAQSFDRPDSSRSVPAGGRYRKSMKDITGFGTTEAEFEDLPIAIRRKYFSTLERLRFAQSAQSNASDDLPIQHHRRTSLADRRSSTAPVGGIRPRQLSTRRLRTFSRQRSVSSDSEASWFLTLPEKIQKRQFTKEEQTAFGNRRRDSVILDAADEAVYKARRRASRNPSPLLRAPAPSTTRSSMDTSMDKTSEKEKDSSMVDAMYETFRWMDEEKDLDLSLLPFDDYHANLDGVVIPTPASTRKPSFRRQMSISGLPFSRSSLSSIQPRSPKTESPPSRQRTRTMSLIGPRHIPQNSVSSIEPNAAHYRDPEARLKLRVYLASPQKFDEAIEFGFPSMDEKAGSMDKENKPPTRSSRDNKRPSSLISKKGQSFLEDDTASLFEDEKSEVDSEAPLTPLEAECGYRPQSRTVQSHTSRSGQNSANFSHLGITKPMVVKPQDYAQATAGSREMTLRMTLTRPDLRADESAIYGFQTSKSPLRETPMSLDLDEKDERRGPFGGVDGWGPPDKENGVVKRLWNKVKTSQRKST